VRLLLALFLAVPSSAANYSRGFPGRSTAEGLIPLPDVARSFMPPGLAGFAPLASVQWVQFNPQKLLPASTATALSLKAKASGNDGGPKPGEAPAKNEPGAKAALDVIAGGTAQNDNAPAAGAAGFDGMGRRKPGKGGDVTLPVGAPKPALPPGSLPLPIVRQATDYSCGAAALLAILFYWGVYDGGESELYAELGTTPADGTPPWNLAKGARAHGLDAEMKEHQTLDDLREGLARGETIIVDYQAWKDGDDGKPWKDTWEDGHYSVLAGIDDHYVYLMDPSGGPGYVYIPIAEFLERWHDYETTPAGKVEARQLAIYIKGDKALKTFPGPLIRGE
jgi:predicted double-glycine peptidase